MKHSLLKFFTLSSLYILLLAGCTDPNAKQYDNAKALMESGSYSEAADIFSSISDYEDSADLYTSCMYSQGKAYISDNNYTAAKECFAAIPNYQDATELIAECDHVIAVKNDTTAPTISGISEGDVLEIKFNEDYNLKDYLNSVINITDDVSENLSDYTITTTAKIYDPDNGKIDTLQDGTYDFAISAVDEAQNKATINFSVHIDATLHISKDSEFPVVLYDNELGKYTLNSVIHYSDWESAPDYIEGYYFEIEMQNGSDGDAVAYFGRVYLNDYRVGCWVDSSKPIAPGKKGILPCYLADEDLDDTTKDFEKIECEFAIARVKEAGSTDEELFVRPVVIDRDVIEFK